MKLINYFHILAIVLVVISCNKSQKSDSKSTSTASILKSLESGRNIHLSGVTIKEKIDFTKLSDQYIESLGIIRCSVNGSLAFRNCVFEEEVIAFTKKGKDSTYICRFTKNLVFLNCTFKKGINLRDAVVDGIANFSICEFNDKANFEGISLRHNNNYFTEIVYRKDARFDRMYANGNVLMIRSIFEGRTGFQGARSLGMLNLGGGRFKGEADFSLAHFESLIITGCEFQKNCSFSNANIENRNDWIKTYFKGNLIVNGSILGRKMKIDGIKSDSIKDIQNWIQNCDHTPMKNK